MNKAIYLSILSLFIGYNTFSQDYYPLDTSTPDTTKFKSKPIFRVQGGLNFSNIFEKDDEEIYSENQTITGFHFGIKVEFPTSQSASFETGLLISTKGFKSHFQSYYGDLRDLEYIDVNLKENFVYLDIPLTTKFYFNVLETSKIYGVVGPYVSIGIGGKEKWTDTNIETGKINKDSDNITFGYSDKSWYNLFDFGLVAGAGIDIDPIQIGLTYNLGLANISPDTEEGYKQKNRVMQISVAYKFDLAKITK